VNAEPVVAACRKKEFELEDVVGVLLFRDEVASLANDCSVLHYVVTILPSGQVLPVEEGNGFRREKEKGTKREQGGKEWFSVIFHLYAVGFGIWSWKKRTN
jgi:hypothetical protein